jgi:hypothetical protein
VIVVMERQGAIGVLAVEEKAAWMEYLDSTRGLPETRYREVEPWAWAKLRQKLRAIRARRRAVEERA